MNTTSGAYDISGLQPVQPMRIAHKPPSWRALWFVPYLLIAAVVGCLGAGLIHLAHERQGSPVATCIGE